MFPKSQKRLKFCPTIHKTFSITFVLSFHQVPLARLEHPFFETHAV